MDREYIKNFDEWNVYSKNLDSAEFKGFFYEREIWWCALGVNVGSEQDGKNDNFERPVLIVKKINHNLLWIVPLTSKITSYESRIPIKILGQKSQLLLSQIRSISSRRLLRKIGIAKAAVFYEALVRLGLVLFKTTKGETPPNLAAERGISEP
jgi:mRNA-degrading endonuclease toxin of MazEF toxin-antitoxin module